MARDGRLVVFISSSMEELKPERKAVRSAIKATKGFEPFAWESDATAHDHSAQEEWTKQLARADATIVVLWKKLGKWTRDEIDISRDRGIPILLFRKRDEDETLQKKEGAYLDELENVQTGVAAKYFKSPEKLKKFVDKALWALFLELARAGRERDLDDKDEVRGLRRRATTSEHGLILEEAAGPTIRPRDAENMRHLSPNRWTFIGRASEKSKLMRAIGSDDQLVAITGPPGIGKKTLLRDVTYHEDVGHGFRDGVAINPDWVDRQNLEDLFQAIWEEFYVADDPGVVEPRKRRRQLAGKEALIFLPDLELPPHQIEQLLDEMPQAVFCVSGDDRALAGKHIALEGFADTEEMLALFEDRYRAPIPAEARTSIGSMCASLGGNPSLIGLLADRAWGEAEDVPGELGEHPLSSWAATHSKMTAEELRDWLVPPGEQRAVAVANATEVHTPRRVMVHVVGSAESVDDALADNLIEESSPRYRVNAALATDTANNDELMSEVFQSALEWVAEAGANEIYADRVFVLRMMEWGTDHARWSDVVSLGMACEAPMSLGGRHGAWEKVLLYSLDAARAMEPVDEGAEAWALHQLGSRALLRDDLGTARILLHESLRCRPDGNEDARAVTRRNLGLIPAAIVSVGVLLLWLVFLVPWGAALQQAGGPFDANLDVTFQEVPAPALDLVIQATEVFQAESADGAVFAINLVPITAGESSFCIVLDGSCALDQSSAAGASAGSDDIKGLGAVPATSRPLALAAESQTPCRLVVRDDTRIEVSVPDDRGCFIEIGFQPQVPGTHKATLELVAETDAWMVTGDLSGKATPAPVPISEIDRDVESFRTANETKSFRIENVGTASFDVGAIDDFPDGFELGEDHCSRITLEPGQSCEFIVKFLGGSNADFLELDLSPAPTARPVAGDHAILLVGNS